jgi:hypothetical protein
VRLIVGILKVLRHVDAQIDWQGPFQEIESLGSSQT